MKVPKRIALALVPVSFLACITAIVLMASNEVVTPQMGLLLGVALFGCYVGFGILIAVYRLINKLD